MSYEKALIGTVLQEPNTYLDVYHVQPDDFLSVEHRHIWRQIIQASEKDALSYRVIVEEMRNLNQLDTLEGGEDYLKGLLLLGDTAGLKEFAYQVVESSTKRELERLGRLLALETGDSKTSKEIIEEHIRNLLLLRRDGQSDPIPVGALLPEFNERQLKIAEGKIEPYWYPPVQAIADVLHHMIDVDFQIMVAPTSRGKSSLLRYYALKTAGDGHKVLTLTLENSIDECLSWGVAYYGNINHYHVQDPRKMTNAEKGRHEEAKEKVEEIPWYIKEMGVCTINDVMNTIKRFKLQHQELKLVQVDGMYLIGGRGETYEVIANSAQSLRSLAQELHVPIIATTQFNRGVNHKEEPDLDNLLYAGENPARQVVALMPMAITPTQASLFPENILDGRMVTNLNAVVMQAKILKNTGGQIGMTDPIKWVKSTGRYETLVPNWAGNQTPKPSQHKEQFLKAEKEKALGYSKDRQTRDYTV